MRIQCNACGAEYRVAEQKVAGRAVQVRCRACESPIHVAAPAVAKRQEGSGLLDIRAMAAVLGDGQPAPGPSDEVAFGAQPSLPTALPTAGVIMPVMKSDRPWWLVPSLALGGVLLVTVVALLAVLMLQPRTSSTPNAGDPLPGAAASNGKAPAGPASVTGSSPILKERVVLSAPAPVRDPKPATGAPQGKQPAPAIRSQPRRPAHSARTPKHRPRKDPKAVRHPRRDPKVAPTAEPRRRPRSITEILVAVNKPKPDAPKATPRASLPARLAFRDIQRGMAQRLGAARACGRRYSTTGRVSVRLVVVGATGRVRSVTPKGAHAASQTGRCVARALHAVKFKPFARSSQSFYFTVILR